MPAAELFKLAALTLTIVLIPQAYAAPILFTDFNLVVGGNLHSSSEVDGRTLVGGNLSGPASNYAVKLTPSSNFSEVDTLVVGGNISALHANVNAGDIRVGGTVTGNVNRNGAGSDLFQNDSMVAAMVSDALAGMSSFSSYLGSLEANSGILNASGPSAVTFNAIAGPGAAAVFSLDGAIFSDPNSQQYDLNVGEGVETLIFNVLGSGFHFNQGNFVGGFTNAAIRPNMIWNFQNASTIQLDRNWFGALLAPKANLTNSTAMEGSVFIGGNFNQNGEVHLPLLDGGTLPEPVPEPSTLYMLGGALLVSAAGRRLHSRLRVS